MAYRLAPGACVVALVVAMALARPLVSAELRLMNADNVTAASPCIGNPVTPLCAAETAAACAIAPHKPYCDVVDRYFDAAAFDSWDWDYRLIWQRRYEYLGEKVLRQEDIPDRARHQYKRSWKPGDVALRLQWQDCPPNDACYKPLGDDYSEAVRRCRTFANCRTKDRPQTYILRRRDDKWIFVDINYDDILPKSFWNGH